MRQTRYVAEQRANGTIDVYDRRSKTWGTYDASGMFYAGTCDHLDPELVRALVGRA